MKEAFENKSFEQDKKETEIMKVPEIVVRPERGAHLLSVILKGRNPEWGNCNSELAQLANKHFGEHPLSLEISNAIGELAQEGIDEESLYNLSLTYQHPERMEHVFLMLEKYKGIDRETARIAHGKLVEALEGLDKDATFTDLDEKFEEEAEKDVEEKRGQLEEAREKIKSLIDFFQPKRETKEIETVNLMPTDALCHERSGSSFSFGREIVLRSSPEDSTQGQAHEFLHGIINPVVDKLEKTLTEDQKWRIAELASGKIKQHYGEGKYYSHLCEGFIRTYLNIFEKGEKPKTYEDFQELIAQRIANEEQFREALAQDRELKQRCETLGIRDLKGLVEKSKDYFETYEKDKLGEIIYECLGDYKEKREDNPGLTFEDYILEKFAEKL